MGCAERNVDNFGKRRGDDPGHVRAMGAKEVRRDWRTGTPCKTILDVARPSICGIGLAEVYSARIRTVSDSGNLGRFDWTMPFSGATDFISTQV